jgi:hypothetical protein
MTISPATVVKVGWPAGPAYAGSFMLDSATRGVLDGTTYTLADETLVELARVLTAKSTAGRSTRYDAPSAGTLTVNLEDPLRELDPTNTAGPYYGSIEARRPITLASRWTVGGTAVDIPAWSGYVDDIVGDYRGAVGRVTITAIDLIGLLNFTVSDSASNRPAESCADRIRYLVGLIGFPVAEGFADAGRTVIAMDLEGKNVLTILRGIELADQGRFIVNPSGSWSYISNLTDTTPTITATNTPDYDAAEVPLAAAPMSSSLSRYYNSVSVARWFGTPQIAENADDIARFGRRSPTAITELPIALDSDAADVASLILLRASSRTPTPRSATINLHAIATSAGGSVGAGAAAATLLAEAQAATMRVVTMFAAGTPSEVSSVAIVDKVTTDAAPGRWTTTVELSPVPVTIRPIELDDATLAVLDTGRVGF